MSWEVRHGDCLDVLRAMPDASVDAIVTDPPYGVGFNTDYTRFPSINGKNKKHKPVLGDDARFDPTPWLRFPLVAMFGFNCFSNKLPIGSLLVWNKRRESMLGKWMADAEVAWMNKGHGVYLFNHEWHGSLRASERGHKRQHPTQKPIEVMKWVLDRLGVPVGATVLDPYCGSGTTGVACVQTGRNFIGIEREAEYVEIARARIAQAESKHSETLVAHAV